jgi:DNA-directed RNA polymerase specialized sigma subunit
MQRVFNEAGVAVDVPEMFPDYYIGFGGKRSLQLVQIEDLSAKQLENFATHQQLTLEDAQVPVAETLLDSQEALKALHDRSIISEREQRILTARFIDDKSCKEIGEEIGVGSQRIHQLIHIALGKIRRKMNATSPAGREWINNVCV